MSEKHVQALAEEKPVQPPNKPATWLRERMFQWQNDCAAIAQVCSTGDPGFDWERFMRACGVD